jgi:hypothetical protein
MNFKESMLLRNRWGDKTCDHPHLVRESERGFSTGDYICTQCRRIVDWSDYKKNEDKVS